MLFSSVTFLYGFLPILLILYFAFDNIKYRNTLLIFFSIIFYAWGEPILVALLIIISLINYCFALKIENSNDKTALLFIAILLNIINIFYFKYLNFFIKIINLISGLSIESIKLRLPLGISFYTFQAISYLIDVKRGDVKAIDRFSNYFLYISFFPQLIAGPIVRYIDVKEQIIYRKTNFLLSLDGLYRFSQGLAKKVFLANNLGKMITLIMDNGIESVSLVMMWGIVIIYSLQIYFDFSGYSDMAIGLAKIFGFKFEENFNYPYISQSVTNFWEKWHISLSSFFRDYVFYPVAYTYQKPVIGLLIVWILTGLWHGADYNYIIWGIYYFIILFIEKKFIIRNLKKFPQLIKKTIGFIYTIFFVLIANNIFYREDLNELIYSFRVMFGFTQNNLMDVMDISLLRRNFILLILSIIFTTPVINNVSAKLLNKCNATINSIIKIFFIFILLLLSTIYIVGESYNPFLYFRF